MVVFPYVDCVWTAGSQQLKWVSVRKFSNWQTDSAWHFYEPFSLDDPAGQAIKIPVILTSDKQLEGRRSISCDITKLDIRKTCHLQACLLP